MRPTPYRRKRKRAISEPARAELARRARARGSLDGFAADFGTSPTTVQTAISGGPISFAVADRFEQLAAGASTRSSS